MAWSDSPWNPKNWGGGSSSGSSGTSFSRDSGDDPISNKMDSDADATMPRNSALDDLQMDLGLKPKNAAYYRDLGERSARSQAAMEQAMRSSDDDGPASAPEEEETEEEEVVETVAPKTSVETISQSIDELIAELLAGRQGQFDPSFVSGPAEEEAMEFEEKGRKSTIKTAPRGIVDLEDSSRLRPKRSLLAGQ